MSKIKNDEITWLSENYINKDCRSQSFKHYRKVKTPNLVVEIGDFVLILNADAADETESEEDCLVARVVSLYEDTSNKICPYKSKVQWYSRSQDLPKMNMNKVILNKAEVVEDHRPYSTDVLIQTFLKKCIISFKFISPTPFDYLCRYRLIVVNNNTGKYAIEAIVQGNQEDAEMPNVSTLDRRRSFKRKGGISDQNKISVSETIIGSQSRNREKSPVSTDEIENDRQSRKREISSASAAETEIDRQSRKREISPASAAESKTVIGSQSRNREKSPASTDEIENDRQSRKREISSASAAETEIDRQSRKREISPASAAESKIDRQSRKKEISPASATETEIDRQSRKREISAASAAETEIDGQSRKREISPASAAETEIDRQSRKREISPASAAETEIDRQSRKREISPASAAETEIDRQSRKREISPASAVESKIDRQSRKREISPASAAATEIDRQSRKREISAASAAETEIDGQSRKREISPASAAETEIDRQSRKREISPASAAETEIDRQSRIREISPASAAATEIDRQSRKREISPASAAETEIDRQSRKREISPASAAETEIDRQSRKREISPASAAESKIYRQSRKREISPISFSSTEFDEIFSGDTDSDEEINLMPSPCVRVECIETGEEIVAKLPGRERHEDEIYSYLRSKVVGKASGCMYISGGTGSGKSTTITAALNRLNRERQKLPKFRILKYSGRKHSDPTEAYVKIYKRLTGNRVEWELARLTLNKKFARRRLVPTIIVLDEIDYLHEQRRQETILNIMRWTTAPSPLLTIVVVSNMTKISESDLFPEGFEPRVQIYRQYFMPYSYTQLYVIVNCRMKSINITSTAMHLLVRKLGPVTGDARHALEICERVIELAGPGGAGEDEVKRALGRDYFNTVFIIRQCSFEERLILRAVAEEVKRTYNHETTLNRIVTIAKSIVGATHHQFEPSRRMSANHHQFGPLRRMSAPTPSQALSTCSRLATQRLLLLQPRLGDLKIYLNVSAIDVFRATSHPTSRFHNNDFADD